MSSCIRLARWVPLFVATSLLSFSARAFAQCGPDGFSGPCCTGAVPTLPTFPKVQLPGSSICWNGCLAANQLPSIVDWSAPAAINCTESISYLTITDGGTGLPVMAGVLVLDYTRTWNEIDPAGNVHQVWRFVAKADVATVTSGSVWPCHAPACIQPVGPQQNAFYYGYVDYSHSCVSGANFESSIVLHHAADFFIHRPGLSSAPGVFHPNASYAIVAPHSSTQMFLPSNSPAPQGPIFFDATRDFGSLVPPFCLTSDPMLSGQVTTFGGFCLTTLANGPKQHWLRSVAGQGACLNTSGQNGSFQSVALNFPTLPWFHLVSASIGQWTNPNVWPGNERAWVDEGVFIHQNVCTGNWVNVNYGATTKDGWQILHPVLLTTFTDLADNYNAPLFGPYPGPIVGNVKLSTKLIYVTQP